jgi:PAS domain S-box-containing protein
MSRSGSRPRRPRKRSAALREQLSQLAATVPGVIYSATGCGPTAPATFPYLSPRLLDVFGVTAESAQAAAERPMALIHPDDLPDFSASIAASAAALSPWHGEFRIWHPRKGLVWLEATSMPVREEHGDIVWHGFMFDITGRKALEEARRGSTPICWKLPRGGRARLLHHRPRVRELDQFAPDG